MTKQNIFNVYRLILQLEEPSAINPGDNKLYRVDQKTLGILYSHVISEAKPGYSPAIILTKNESISLPAEEEFQKRFQVRTRYFLKERLGDLLLRQHTAEEFSRVYYPVSFREDFAKGTIESIVASLAKEQEFEEIGKRLKSGARNYDHTSRRKNMPNYRFAAEYQAILQALKSTVES